MIETPRTHPGYNPYFEASNVQRLTLIEEMNTVHSSTDMHPKMFERRTQEIGNRIIELSARPEVYSLQVYGLATQLAALNPNLASMAEAIISGKFADEAELNKKAKGSESKNPELSNTDTDAMDPIAHDAIEIVNKTKEYALEADDDTITLSRIAITASMDYMEEQIKELPDSPLMQKIADSHEQKPQQLMAEAEQSTPRPVAPVIELQTGYMQTVQPEKVGISGLLRRAVGR